MQNEDLNNWTLPRIFGMHISHRLWVNLCEWTVHDRRHSSQYHHGRLMMIARRIILELLCFEKN